MTAELGQPGQIIDGKYRIVRLLGSGGMGAVFEGENVRIRRKVAIKMLHGSVQAQEDVVKRFEREAQAAALVGSDHICEVLDLGELPDKTKYMVMEYLEGDTLSGLIKRSGRLKPPQAIPILTQILDALGAAHAAGIIHRDLKPDNVFILPQKGGIQNFVKILDFGVSKFSQLGGEAMNVTRAGAVVGTPYYMSPEQARGSSAIDQRTDIYAIGVLLYQATTGQVPYQAETFNELLFKIVLEVAPPPQVYVPDLDPEYAAIIQRAMAREPDQRFQSCQQFREALVQYQAARANPLPAFNLPKFHEDGPSPARTEVLNLHGAPGAQGGHPGFGQSSPGYGQSSPGYGQSSPGFGQSSAANPGLRQSQPGDGTMPMQPGLPLGGSFPPGGSLAASGAGSASPMQSGASWPHASHPGAIPVGPAGPSATANSWGNASSPSNALPKKSGSGVLLGVVGGAAVVGIGVAVVAFMAMGKSKGSATQPSANPTTSAVVTASAAPSAPPATTAPATTAEATAADTATPAPTASASATAAATKASATPVETAKPATPTRSPATPVQAAGGKPTGKPGGAATGKPAGGKPSKGGGNDLGY